jgi:Ca2+-binding EF-hand superfamily protein
LVSGRSRRAFFQENALKRQTIALLAASFTLLAPVVAQSQTNPPPAPPVQPPATPTTPPTSSMPMTTPGAKPQRMGSDKFDAVDANHDGAISREEAAAAPKLAGTCDEIDADHDGRVVPAELKAYAKTHRGAEGKAGKIGKDLTSLDANHDGIITRDEVAANPKAMKRFEAADADHDGRVTAEEAAAARGR